MQNMAQRRGDAHSRAGSFLVDGFMHLSLPLRLTLRGARGPDLKTPQLLRGDREGNLWSKPNMARIMKGVIFGPSQQDPSI